MGRRGPSVILFGRGKDSDCRERQTPREEEKKKKPIRAFAIIICRGGVAVVESTPRERKSHGSKKIVR